jgi:hypothetical protein
MIAPGCPAPAVATRLQRDERRFEPLLSGMPAADRLTSAAEELVSAAFIAPVLEMLRESPFLAEPFAPGSAERRFMPLLDQRIADEITRAANFPLVRSIVARYEALAGRIAAAEEAGHAAP